VETRNLVAFSQDEQMRFLRKWCDAHPKADYSRGVRELFKRTSCNVRSGSLKHHRGSRDVLATASANIA